MAHEWRFLNRFNTLPTPGGGNPIQIAPQQRHRIAGPTVTNVGFGSVYISHMAAELNQAVPRGKRIPPGASYTFSTAPIAPHNELYAVGDAGHDIDVDEVIETTLEGTR